MKFGWVKGMLLLLVGAFAPRLLHAQASVYGEFSASDLQGTYLYGGQGGVLIDGHKFHHVLLQADIQGRGVTANSRSLLGVVVGPRFSVNTNFLKLSPFAEFNVGFARYNDGANHSSTDSTFGGDAGITRQITPRFDAVVDYRYEIFAYNFTQFEPKSYSGGVIYHFVKR